MKREKKKKMMMNMKWVSATYWCLRMEQKNLWEEGKCHSTASDDNAKVKKKKMMMNN